MVARRSRPRRPGSKGRLASTLRPWNARGPSPGRRSRERAALSVVSEERWEPARVHQSARSLPAGDGRLPPRYQLVGGTHGPHCRDAHARRVCCARMDPRARARPLPRFDVASVKQDTSGEQPGNNWQASPGRNQLQNAQILQLIRAAFGDFSLRVEGFPEWTVSNGTTWRCAFRPPLKPAPPDAPAVAHGTPSRWWRGSRRDKSRSTSW